MPIPSGRIQRWIRDGKSVETSKKHTHRSPNMTQGLRTCDEKRESLDEEKHRQESIDTRYDTYMSLIDLRIRNAYVSLPIFEEYGIF